MARQTAMTHPRAKAFEAVAADIFAYGGTKSPVPDEDAVRSANQGRRVGCARRMRSRHARRHSPISGRALGAPCRM